MIRFERILAAALMVAVVLKGRLDRLIRAPALFVYLLFGVMCISFLLSDYQQMNESQLWRNYYWKKVVFFVFLLACIYTKKQIKTVFYSITFIILFYELYSWFDFVRGGSYVYQQGMKRIIGTWSVGGFGAANQFGVLGMIALPFAVYMLRAEKRPLWRLTGGFAYLVGLMSIVFSGTRGAMVVAGLYTVFELRKAIFRPVLLLLILAGLWLAIPRLPEDIRHRYWNLTFGVTEDSLSRTDEVAMRSARGRIQGLVDGWKLGQMKPLWGFGPGSSPAVRGEFLTDEGESSYNLQLHNLYGQLPAETGFVGLAVWLSLMAYCLVSLARIMRESRSQQVRSMTLTLMSALLVFSAYGMGGHTLYNEIWLILIALTSAVCGLFSEEETETLLQKRRPGFALASRW